ncbi:GDSL-like Lipase/Acylhydrolase superfamily protein [Striga asiatica]|uniref:GDSL-like Lipase/Acylhydrolase superfamily protein n=1 Tax=Striga asiatica TaxID=4170 RepID=A0A5A7QL33_STRAF|nr:GDSL-like Lipase/Acylhydrolase superfamily protein [Striga asiatica]
MFLGAGPNVDNPTFKSETNHNLRVYLKHCGSGLILLMLYHGRSFWFLSDTGKTFRTLADMLMIMTIMCFCVPFATSGRQPYPKFKFSQIYQLGDSISDTGNTILYSPCAKLPYGESFPKGPTGRCSNGFLIIDYIAKAARLPLLPPYHDTTADFSHGVNFAVAGATALSPNALARKNIQAGGNSLDVQLGWMSSYFNSICSSHSGEVGGNDYNFAMSQRKSMEEMREMVPDVVDAILDGVRKAISFGAKKLVVPGNFPIGCIPGNKAAFHTDNQTAYDRYKCLKYLNEFAAYHNQQLQQGIQRLNEQEQPNATILYADFYKAYMFALRYSRTNGIDTENVCCGMCGFGVQACQNPDSYLSWDGMHMTQECYKLMSAWLIHNLFIKLQ